MELEKGQRVWVADKTMGGLFWSGVISTPWPNGEGAWVKWDHTSPADCPATCMIFEKPCRAQTPAGAATVVTLSPTREKVKSGQYKIGDRVNGHAIVDFGKAWRETEAGAWGKRGTLYQDCAQCGRNCAVDLDSDLCEKCGANGEDVTVCYAYFK